jgi:hypothetical protein
MAEPFGSAGATRPDDEIILTAAGPLVPDTLAATTIGRRPGCASEPAAPAYVLARVFYGECRLAPCSETPFLAVRHGIETRYDGQLYRESFAPECWAAKAEPATIRLGHDGADGGRVVVVTSHGQWHHASFLIEDGPLLELAREQIVVGAKVSLDCRTWKPD